MSGTETYFKDDEYRLILSALDRGSVGVTRWTKENIGYYSGVAETLRNKVARIQYYPNVYREGPYFTNEECLVLKFSLDLEWEYCKEGRLKALWDSVERKFHLLQASPQEMGYKKDLQKDITRIETAIKIMRQVHADLCDMPTDVMPKEITLVSCDMLNRMRKFQEQLKSEYGKITE